MINKLKDAGADVLAVTNSSEIKALADSSIDIPEGVSDFISPLSTPLQDRCLLATSLC